MTLRFVSNRQPLGRPQVLLFADAEACARKQRSVHETLRLALEQQTFPELCVVLRVKTKLQDWDPHQIAKIKTLCANAEVMLVAHNDPLGAMKYGFEGVHLSSSFDVSEARRKIGEDRWLSRSCHINDSQGSHQITLCDGVTISPVYRPISKPNDHRQPLGLEAAANWIDGIGIAAYALGGLRPLHIGAVRSMGFSGVAILGSVMEANNPGEALNQYIDAVRHLTVVS